MLQHQFLCNHLLEHQVFELLESSNVYQLKCTPTAIVRDAPRDQIVCVLFTLFKGVGGQTHVQIFLLKICIIFGAIWQSMLT